MIYYRARHYSPLAGLFNSKDNLNNTSYSKYAYCSNNPQLFTDPSGCLQRRQLEYLACLFVENWPGIDKADTNAITNAMKTIKSRLQVLSPKGFSNGDSWSSVPEKDDLALQSFVEDRVKAGDKAWIGFPLDVYSPAISDIKRMLDIISSARSMIHAPGVDPVISDELLISMIMYESLWMPNRSTYGWTLGKSSAVGLMQVTRSTYNSNEITRYLYGGSEGILFQWTEDSIVDPVTNVAAGLAILYAKRGGKIEDTLMNYKGPGGAKYAKDVMAGMGAINKYLKDVNRSLSTLDQGQSAELFGELKNALGR